MLLRAKGAVGNLGHPVSRILADLPPELVLILRASNDRSLRSCLESRVAALLVPGLFNVHPPQPARQGSVFVRD